MEYLTKLHEIVIECCPAVAVAAALLLLFGIYRLAKRQRRCIRRASVQALTSILVEKPPSNDDAPPSYSASSMEEHGRGSLSGSSLIRRTKSISSSSGPRKPLTIPEQVPFYPKTLRDIPLVFKINLLQGYVKQHATSFVFRPEQSERLSRLDDFQLDTFFSDIICEIQRRNGSTKDHQVLSSCPELSENRKEAINRMASIEQSAFVEMAHDFLYELQRRQRISQELTEDQSPSLLPADILVRNDIDWKGFDKRTFGKLRIEEAELVQIVRTEHAHRFQCYLFDRIFLAFKPHVTPHLKGRVFTCNMSQIKGWEEQGVYKLTMYWSNTNKDEGQDQMTMLFRDETTWQKWANELRDAVLRQRGQGKVLRY